MVKHTDDGKYPTFATGKKTNHLCCALHFPSFLNCDFFVYYMDYKGLLTWSLYILLGFLNEAPPIRTKHHFLN